MIETCLICGEYMGPFKNDLKDCTGFSEQPIYELFGEISYQFYFQKLV